MNSRSKARYGWTLFKVTAFGAVPASAVAE